MRLTTFDQNLNSPSSHYRMVSALADQEKLFLANPETAAEFRQEVSLSSVAASMDVPVVLATYYNENGVRTYATHGLGRVKNIALFVAACNELCADQAIAIPNTKTHKLLGGLAKQWPDDDICFLVGVPLRNALGQRVGSLAVMNSQQVVARTGISFKTLNAFGKAFAHGSRLPTAVAAQ